MHNYVCKLLLVGLPFRSKQRFLSNANLNSNYVISGLSFSSSSSFSVLLCIYTLLYLLNLFMYMYVILHNYMCLRRSDITVLAVYFLSNVSLMLSLVCLFFFFFFFFLCIPLHLHPSFTSLIYLCMCRFIYIYREREKVIKNEEGAWYKAVQRMVGFQTSPERRQRICFLDYLW